MQMCMCLVSKPYACTPCGNTNCVSVLYVVVWSCSTITDYSLDVVITCPGAVVPHGVVVPPGPVQVNFIATVQCDDGYKLTGFPTVKCVLVEGQTTAAWNGTFSSCESKCVCILACWLYVCTYACT